MSKSERERIIGLAKYTRIRLARNSFVAVTRQKGRKSVPSSATSPSAFDVLLSRTYPAVSRSDHSISIDRIGDHATSLHLRRSEYQIRRGTSVEKGRKGRRRRRSSISGSARRASRLHAPCNPRGNDYPASRCPDRNYAAKNPGRTMILHFQPRYYRWPLLRFYAASTEHRFPPLLATSSLIGRYTPGLRLPDIH